ncbi:MAG: hypothetical protein RJA90_521 [Bacteroidota bacterium]
MSVRVYTLMMLVMLTQGIAYANQDQFLSSLAASRSAFGAGQFSLALEHAEKAKGLAEGDSINELFILEQQVDFCLQVLKVDCAGKYIVEHTKVYSKAIAVAADKEIYKWRIISNLEKTVQVFLLTRDYLGAEKLVKTIEDLLQTTNAIAGQSNYIDANLTLARWYEKAGRIEEAERALNRAWVTFVCFENVGDFYFIKYGPQFISILNKMGRSEQASSLGYLITPVFIRSGAANKYHSMRFGSALGDVRGGEGNSIAAINTHTFGLEFSDVEFDSKSKKYFEIQAKGEILLNCVIFSIDACKKTSEYAVELERLLSQNEVDSRTKFSIAMILSFYRLSVNEILSDEIVKALDYDIESKEWDQQGTIAYLTVVKLKDFIKSVKSLNKERMYQFIQEASLIELKRIHDDEIKKPFGIQTLNSSQKILLTIYSFFAANNSDLTREQQEMLFEVNEYQNKAARSVESQYLRNLSKVVGRLDQSNLQSIHRINQDISLLEKRILGKNISSANLDSGGKQFKININAFVRLNGLYLERSKFDDFAKKLIVRENGTSLARLQSKLRVGERYINYQVLNGVENNLIITCLSKDQFWHAQSTLSAIKVNDVKLLQAALSNPSPPSKEVDESFPIQAALRISKATLSPIKSCLVGANHLYFMQDESIAGLPHAVLIDPNDKSFSNIDGNEKISNVPWLGLRYSVGVINGAYHLISSRDINYTKLVSSGFLGIGDPVLSGKTEDGVARGKSILRGISQSSISLRELEELPDTKAELINSARSYGVNSKLLMRENATEVAIRRLPMRPYDVISFATHGLVREELPGLVEPALVLTPANSSLEVNDGIFTATDISRMDLNANLVILSACNSARFNVNMFAPEAASLSTAFFLAGSKATMASLWSVNSDATSLLMQEFSKNYSKGGVSSSEALRLAMHQLQTKKFKGKDYSNPRYWAAFVIHGDSSPRNVSVRSEESKQLSIEVDQSFNDKNGHIQEAVKFGETTVITGAKPNPKSESYKGYVLTRGKHEFEFDDPDYFYKAFKLNGQVLILSYPVNYDTDKPFTIFRMDLLGKLIEYFKFPRQSGEIPSKPIALVGGKFILPTTVLSKQPNKMLIHTVDVSTKSLVATKRITLSFSEEFSEANVNVIKDGLINISMVGLDRAKVLPNQLSPFGLVQPCSAMYGTELIYLNSKLEERQPRRSYRNLKIYDSVEYDDKEIWSFSETNSCTGVEVKQGLVTVNGDGSLTPKYINLGGYSGVPSKLIETKWGVVAVGRVTRRFDSSSVEDVKFDMNVSVDPIASSNNQIQTGIFVTQFNRDLVQYSNDVMFGGLNIFVDSLIKSSNDDLQIFGASGDRRFVAKVHLVGESGR